jgi:hypothetical protein
MLAYSKARGLPGATIERVEFQRADDGFPLDDVILHAHENTTGHPATLQIQVKRSISFSPGDAVFKKVVGQITKAIREPDFWTGRNELAIATSRTSRKIDGAYQDVLRWARQLGSAQSFFARLNRPGAGNDDMRTFVGTLRDHLREAGAPHDDETVWKVLARFQILVFDYTAFGSATEELSRERAVRVLPPEDTAKASTLWNVLIDLAEEVAADGGDRDRARLAADLANRSIRIAGDRRLADVRSAVAEASAQALADLNDRIGATSLARTERVEAVNEALDRGRYVEIRGDAGVGKSGVLRHFAELLEAEARIVVLSPGRIAPRGWVALRSQLGFNGTARELLGDLASDGGAVLFIDNLDSFSDDERRTVNDLVRGAAAVPGISVIATARRNFDVDEPSWLDSNAVKALDPTSPVVIEELSEAEVAELSDAEPRLAIILADSHPGRREVVRNLYRLSRLAARPSSRPTPTTELDMAEEWWSSADGERDSVHRERARLLRALAEMALGGAFVLDVKDEAPTAIEALVMSETLRDLGNDRVSFRHDVLRQWAIGNLLASDEGASEKLPLDKPASAILARGVELAARFALEREPNGDRWVRLLDRLSRNGVHGSWRRSALLALVHSEAAVYLLDRVSVRLLDKNATLLRELIRTVMAVDVEPASQLLARLGVNTAQIPPGMFVSAGASWVRLILWLLKLGTNVPAQALGDVAELYTNWMWGTLGHGPFTSSLAAWLHAWLVELEEDRIPRATPRSYSGELGYREDRGLLDNLRTGFLMFCNKVPHLATDYLNRVRAREYAFGIVPKIMKFRGALAQAAPEELAALTAESLIANPDEDEAPYPRREREQPFQFLDNDFLPAGPSQGPFLELLTHAPDHGLDLIRKLVDHAIQFSVRGRSPDDDGFVIPFDDGERFFPWTSTYRWSRGESAGFAMGSGLMALEAWAHRRIEAGENFEAVLKDVLGPPGTSAAFVLIAVDLILSHWPKSQAAAVPFLGCPELVTLDRTRQMQDQIPPLDFFDASTLEKAPTGAATRDSLKQRPSRGVPLERLVGIFGSFGPEDLRAKLERLLCSASQRLGAPEATSTFADSKFMAQHELNLINSKNWREREAQQQDGTTVQGREYVPPESEASHLAALTAEAAPRFEAANMRAALLLALDDPSQSSPQIAAQGVRWARGEHSRGKENDDDDADFARAEGVRAAALVAIRDGSEELRLEHGAWAEQVLIDALGAPDDVAHRMRRGLNFNPVATAFAGIAELYRRDPSPKRLRTLLEIAARETPAGAHGFAVAAIALAEVDERIPKAVIRCAFAAAVKPVLHWDITPKKAERRSALYAARTAKAVEHELAWLNGATREPGWPRFEAEGTRPIRRRQRRGFRIADLSTESEAVAAEQTAPPQTYVDEQAAAIWIGAIRSLLDVSRRPWLRELASAYADFSANLNGLGLGPGEELSPSASAWNAKYYPLLACALVGLSQTAIDELALSRVAGLPDEGFFDVMPQLLRAVDVIYFNDHLLEIEAPPIRQRFIDRLKESSGWRGLVGSRSSSIEIHLGPAVATVFFNDHVLGGRTSSYLTPKAVERIGPFLPQLIDLLTSGPSYFVALVTMDLLETSPRPSLLPLLVAGGKAWCSSYPDDTTLWVEHGIGRRVCAWIDRVRQSSPEALSADRPKRQDIDMILAALVRLGVAEARQLEAALAAP